MDKKPKILVVEDEGEIRKIMISFLVSHGFACVPACSGTEAIETLKKQEFVLVISDVNMPEGDGLWLLEKARKQGYLLPFILMSGDIRSDFSERAKNLGASALLPKPMRGVAVLEVIEAVLKRKIL